MGIEEQNMPPVSNTVKNHPPPVAASPVLHPPCFRKITVALVRKSEGR